MIGIICAMQEEINQILLLMENVKKIQSYPFNFFLGSIKKKECVIALSNVGKVHAAICCQAMILNYKPKLILNVGVAGAISEKLKIGDIVIASETIQHDFDISAFPNRKKGEISGINSVEIKCTPWIAKRLANFKNEFPGISVKEGTILTGDQFINSLEKRLDLKKEFGGLACEMEAGSIAQTAFVNKVEFGIVRSISDAANHTSSHDFNSFIESSSKNAAKLCSKFIESL